MKLVDMADLRSGDAEIAVWDYQCAVHVCVGGIMTTPSIALKSGPAPIFARLGYGRQATIYLFGITKEIQCVHTC